MKLTCTSTTPQLSERADADACLSTLHSKIDPSELAAKGVLRARRETAFSPESAAGYSEAGSHTVEVFSALLRGEAQIVVGVLKLIAYYRAARDGQAFPTRELRNCLKSNYSE